MALVPHKSLNDLKPAQLSLLTSSLQLSVDTTKKQQQQKKLKHTTGQTIYGSGWPDASDGANSHIPWGLSNLPDETQSLLFGKGGPVGSFIAVPETRYLQEEQQKSQLGKSKDQKSNSSETNGSTTNVSGANTSGSLSSTTMALENLFEIISSKTDIDYPVCMDCAEILKEKLKKKYEDECRERDAYISFISKLKAESDPTETEIQQLNDEIAQLEITNAKALEELKQAENEQEMLDKELKKLEEKAKELKQEEERYYETRNEFQLEISDLENQRDRTSSMLELETKTLARLQKVNVYNDVFCIGFDGHFGTINGLRLGRLKDRLVEWSEINAAWGQSLLCLTTIINKIDYKVRGYKLRPQGSMSVIEKLEIDHKSGEVVGRTTYELFSSGDYRFERILNHKRLDAAMVAFLAVLKQVCDYGQSKQPNFRVPHHIHNDKIGEYSIRLSINSSNDNWTTACKYVLTNLKHALAFSTI